VISPRTRRGWIYTQDSIREAKDGIMRANAPAVEVPLVGLFDKDSGDTPPGRARPAES